MKRLSAVEKCALGGLALFLFTLVALGFYDTTTYEYIGDDCDYVCIQSFMYVPTNKNVPDWIYYALGFGNVTFWIVYLIAYFFGQTETIRPWWFNPFLVLLLLLILYATIYLSLFAGGYIQRYPQ